MSLKTLLLMTLPALFLAGCHAVGPDYHRAEVPAPLAWDSEGPWRPGDPKDVIPKGEWWKIFRDPELDRIESAVLAANQDIAAAAAGVEQARALASIAVSNAYPRAGIAPSFERQRLSGNRPSSGVPVTSAISQSAWSLPAVLSYEPDLFGRTRRGIESSNASYQASAADLENVRLVLTAEAASYFFRISALDADVQILDDTVASFEKALALIRNRHEGGISSGLDVAQEEALLEATRTQARVVRQVRAGYEHALAVLCGQPAPGFHIATSSLDKYMPAIPAGIPSDVLERRPDVARGERLMAATNAEIGVAKSAYYPSIGLFATGGFQSTALSSLLNLPSAVWGLGASVAQSLLSGGRNRAGVDFAKSGYDASVAQYRQTVLVAFQEVEDALTSLEVFREAADSQNAAVEAATRAETIAMNRYKGGLVTYLDVATSQQSLLSNQRQLAQIRGDQLVASVMLVKAVGGGWDANSLATLGVKADLKSAFQP